MNRTDAENIVSKHLKPVFGFALRRCRSAQDAEDLSQEIVLRAFRALMLRDDIESPERFIWTVARNALSNYYRARSRDITGVPIDEAADVAAPGEGEDDAVVRRLQSEIAYLTKLQRRIVIAYYFENRRQADIAAELGIPVGTVKWHLFEAKKELKRGMNTMRKTEELKFRPIRFSNMRINGSVGSKSIDEFFRSALSQNICYCVRNEAKTVNEIAEALGVSPVYVESEAEFLEEYGFLTQKKDKYLINFLLDEPTADLLRKQDAMYKRAARLFANDLFGELTTSGLLDDPRIVCAQSDAPLMSDAAPRGDHNFLLWTLIPYIAAFSGEAQREKRISFEEVATIRPDGAQNIFSATVYSDDLSLPDEYAQMPKWCGPMWSGDGSHILWRIDNEWTDRGEGWGVLFGEESVRILRLFANAAQERLSRDDYAWLGERGLIKTNGGFGDDFRSAWQIVILADSEIKARLLALGDRVRARYQTEFQALKSIYTRDALAAVPPHLQKMRAYELQFVFHSDGWFLLHCLTELVGSGKLQPPTEPQRKSLLTMIVPSD